MNDFDQIVAKKILISMIRIRRYEEAIARRYSEQEMRCPTHLSVGQEAVPAVIGELLTKNDLAVSTHRCHAHYLGKGGSGKKMIAELYGKETGCTKGRGGSMHLVDLSCGFKGATSIVGNSIPIGVGLALALKLDKKDTLACVFMGDAAVEEGAFYESANFAAVHHLPVLFVCENNLYSVYSHLKVRQPEKRKIYEMVAAIGVTASCGDGNDALQSYVVLKKAVEAIRQGKGPQFVELATYRWLEHCGPNFDNDIGYRTEAEFQAWKANDPIARLMKQLQSDPTNSLDIEEIEQAIQAEIDAAFLFAKQSSFPAADSAYEGLYKKKDVLPDH